MLFVKSFDDYLLWIESMKFNLWLDRMVSDFVLILYGKFFIYRYIIKINIVFVCISVEV